MSASGKMLKIDEVCTETTLSRPTIYRKQKAGTFPLGKQLAPNRVGWLESEIDRWKADPASWKPTPNLPPAD